MVIYLESSALVKLAVRETESEALRHWLADRPDTAHVTSALSSVEVQRAVMRSQPESLLRAREVVESVDTVPVSEDVLAEAAALGPASLRTLDAVHLAIALRLARVLTAVVGYDDRLLQAAKARGLPVARPT